MYNVGYVANLKDNRIFLQERFFFPFLNDICNFIVTTVETGFMVLNSLTYKIPTYGEQLQRRNNKLTEERTEAKICAK